MGFAGERPVRARQREQRRVRAAAGAAGQADGGCTAQAGPSTVRPTRWQHAVLTPSLQKGVHVLSFSTLLLLLADC